MGRDGEAVTRNARSLPGPRKVKLSQDPLVLEVGTGAAKTGATCSGSWLQVALTLVSLSQGSLLLPQLARSTSWLHGAPRDPGEADLSSLLVKTCLPSEPLSWAVRTQVWELAAPGAISCVRGWAPRPTGATAAGAPSHCGRDGSVCSHLEDQGVKVVYGCRKGDDGISSSGGSVPFTCQSFRSFHVGIVEPRPHL